MGINDELPEDTLDHLPQRTLELLLRRGLISQEVYDASMERKQVPPPVEPEE